MKLRSLAVALAALTLSSASALAQTAAPAPAAAAPVADKATLSYALGYDFGEGLAATGTDIDINAVVRALQDAYGKRPATVQKEKMETALRQFQEKIVGQQKAAYDKALRENTAKSNSFMAANRAKPGITSLASGVQYRVIETGTGAKATNASTVELFMRGTLINGQPFVDTYAGQQAASVKVSELQMPGLKEAVLLMPAGSRWEIFLPPAQAYGNDPRGPGGPGQALVFDIKVASVK